MGETETEKNKMKDKLTTEKLSDNLINRKEGFIHPLPIFWDWPNSQAEDAPDPGPVRSLPSETLRRSLNLSVDPQCHHLYMEMLSWGWDQMNWKCQVNRKCYLCESNHTFTQITYFSQSIISNSQSSMNSHS